MTLLELDPRFVRYETRPTECNIVDGDETTWQERGCPTVCVTEPREFTIPVGSLGEAQGVEFLCPKCYVENGGRVGTHLCAVTFHGRGALPEQGSHNGERPTRWSVSGNGMADLTLSPSIQLIGGCAWHGHVTNGSIT